MGKATGLKGLLDRLSKPKTATEVRSVKSQIRRAVLDNPSITGSSEKDALAQINAMANKRIEEMKSSQKIKDVKSKAKKAAGSIRDTKNEVAGSRERSGFTGNAEKDIEQGKAGKVQSGKKSVPSFADQETRNKNRVKRNERVASLETKRAKGTITKEESAELKRLDKLSSDQDKSRASKAASTASSNARKGKGVSLAGPGGKSYKVGEVKKEPSGQMIGDTKNGINRVTGVTYGNPTPNQVAMAIRDLSARTNLSAEAKRNLAKLKAMSKADKQDATLRRMERRMKNTGPDKSGRPMKNGGMVKKRMAYKDGGYVNCGASVPGTQKGKK